MKSSLRHRIVRTFACTALAAGMAATAQAGTLSIGHTTWVGYGTLYLARDLGYFKEARPRPATDHHRGGLDVHGRAGLGQALRLGLDHR